jgi:GxxExxY protein
VFPSSAQNEQHTEKIIGCAIEVHKTFGARLLESVYRECMIVEMTNAGLRFESERCVKLTYKGVPINVTRMKTGVRRLDHPDLYTRKNKEFLS